MGASVFSITSCLSLKLPAHVSIMPRLHKQNRYAFLACIYIHHPATYHPGALTPSPDPTNLVDNNNNNNDATCAGKAYNHGPTSLSAPSTPTHPPLFFCKGKTRQRHSGTKQAHPHPRTALGHKNKLIPGQDTRHTYIIPVQGPPPCTKKRKARYSVRSAHTYTHTHTHLVRGASVCVGAQAQKCSRRVQPASHARRVQRREAAAGDGGRGGASADEQTHHRGTLARVRGAVESGPTCHGRHPPLWSL